MEMVVVVVVFIVLVVIEEVESSVILNFFLHAPHSAGRVSYRA